MLRWNSARMLIPAFLIITLVLSIATPVLAQGRNDTDDPETDELVYGDLMGGGLCCSLYILFFVIWIFVSYWVYKDARSRGMNGGLWFIIVFLIGIIGLIIYFVVRRGNPAQGQGGSYPQYGGYDGYGGGYGEARGGHYDDRQGSPPRDDRYDRPPRDHYDRDGYREPARRGPPADDGFYDEPPRRGHPRDDHYDRPPHRGPPPRDDYYEEPPRRRGQPRDDRYDEPPARREPRRYEDDREPRGRRPDDHYGRPARRGRPPERDR